MLGDVKGCQLQHVIVCLDHTGLDGVRDRVTLANVGVGDLCDQIVQNIACCRLCQLFGRHLEELFGIGTHLLQPALFIVKRNNNVLRESMHLGCCVRRSVQLTEMEPHVIEVASGFVSLCCLVSRVHCQLAVLRYHA